MVHSAQLPRRSPPRLSRRRFELPVSIAMGAVPHSAAKLASLPSRSGLSPAVHNNAPAVS
jgi:hypothetical protein